MTQSTPARKLTKDRVLRAVWPWLLTFAVGMRSRVFPVSAASAKIIVFGL